MSSNKNIDASLMLMTGSILHGTYRIDGYLSSGGFGNTYVVTHLHLNRKRALKEFFMQDVSEREPDQSSVRVSNTGKLQEFNEQREKFKKEAQRLCDLNNPHIVKVYDLFDENNTSYYVMDFIDGENLKDRLKREGKPMDEATVTNILRQLLDALQEVHRQGLWHMDLKPANIMMDKKGVVKLIDFGASKQIDPSKGGAISTSAVSYTKGYAPVEQMDMNYDKFGPWTDFYALGATIYNLLTGKKPPLPSDINEDTTPDKRVALPYPDSVGKPMRGLVQWMMRTNRNERPQSVNEILNYLNNHLTPKPRPHQPPRLQGYQQQQQPAPPAGHYGPQHGQPAMTHGAMSQQQGQPAKPPKPDSNMVWAILSTLFCCLPLGIVALVNSNRVDELYARGDYQGAEEAARKSKNFVKWSVIAAAIAWIVTIIIMIIAGMSNSGYDGDYGYYDYDTSEVFMDSSDDYYDPDAVADTVAVEAAPADYYPGDTAAW